MMRRTFSLIVGVGVVALLIYWNSAAKSLTKTNHSEKEHKETHPLLSLALLEKLESNGQTKIEIDKLSFLSFPTTNEIGEVVDKFLAPRPKWRLLSEPYPSSPFQKIVLEKFVKEGSKLAQLYDELVKLQYPQSCDSIADDDFDVHRVMDHGFSAILIAPVNFLMWSILHKKTMVLTRGCLTAQTTGCDNGNEYWAWSDRSKCPWGGIDAWSCNFLPATSCRAPPSKYNYKTLEFLNESDYHHSFETDPKWKGAWKIDGDPHCSNLNHDLFWWRSHLSFFLMRPNYQLRKKIFEFNLTQSLVFPGEKCVAMHVRHGDSNGDGRNEEFNVTTTTTLERFVKFTRPYLEKAQTKNLFLFTDDGNVLNETQKFKDINWVTIKKKMYTGWAKEMHAQHFASGDKELEVATMLMTWMTAARCETIIASISEFSNMAYMYAQQTHCPIYVSPLKSDLFWMPAY